MTVIAEPEDTFQIETSDPQAVGQWREEKGLTAVQAVERILAPPRLKNIHFLDQKGKPGTAPDSIKTLLRQQKLDFSSEGPCPDCANTGVVGSVPCPTCQG